MREWQFDGLVGPTHHYAGLATGNLASAYNKGSVSNPRNAALQGISKMRFVHNLGMPQGFLPPHYRPVISELRKHGFSGDLGTVLDHAFRTAPELLSAVYSSAFMWAANAATVTMSEHYGQPHLHFTPANMISHYHRSLEADFQKKSLSSIFHNHELFSIHNPISKTDHSGDEGAANHMYIHKNDYSDGKHIFVYGKSHNATTASRKYLARQDLSASAEIAANHLISPKDCLFFQQNPDAIDRGVFHNDVIAMSSATRMIIHEQALIMKHQQALRDYFVHTPHLRLREVGADELSIEDAVSTYFFNSQLLALPDGRFVLLAPSECMNHAGLGKLIARLCDEIMLDEVHYLDVRESMRNGGGPACLRLRVVTSAKQESFIHPGVVFSDATESKLIGWVNQHYRDRLEFADLRDPQFVKELDDAYSAFEDLVALPGLYDGFRL